MEEQNTLPAVAEQSTSAFSLVMNDEAMDRMMTAAKMMASAKVTIPAHLRNSEGDCMAVIMQAAQWKMNPFAVAQKTHLSQSGALGYEAQLINAVVVSCGAISGQPEFQFIGDWSKILGKVEERKSDKGGKYYVATYNKADENGLGVICRATLRGESEPREITVMLTQCYPRFSTQWATDPQQQITYVAVRKFARRYAPGAILGVYEVDELDTPPVEKEINPQPKRQTGTQAAEQAKQASAAQFDQKERAKLVANLEQIASDYGIEAYAETWSKLTKFERHMVGADEHERLKKVASAIVSTASETTTVDQETGEVGSHE